ncbi:MAG: HAD family hydrolase [Ruminococcaceae bacterium]|nr:HAD family hydrolase [Oscillospiraceae bacterium]
MENTGIENAILDDKGIPITGLSDSEAEVLFESGLSNKNETKVGKSYLKIVADNVFTFFNMIWAIVAAVLIAVGSYSNLTFLIVVVPNTVIALIQEIRAKQTVEKLSVTTDPIATVIRSGEKKEIFSSDIVLGDVMCVEMGRQILSDGVVICGSAEANESMLTGESNAIKKESGDSVLAGSYLVSGAICVRVTSVGKDNYVHKIEKAAKNFKAPSSNLFKELNSLIKYISIFLIPLSLLLFINNYYAYGKDIISAVNKTSGSIVGMIPSGVFLLVTLTLSLSVISLGKKGSLIRDMYSIEMLASADVICLDKTGTITDGTMNVTDVVPMNDYLPHYIERVVSKLEGAEQTLNNTSEALVERFGQDNSVVIAERIPFSSSRKYSAASIVGEGCFSIGAPGFVKCPVTEDMSVRIAAFAAEGKRVLLLAKHPELDAEGEALALIAISDRIRPGAKDTIEKFQDQGVTVKVISGDHAETVSNIAARVGIKNADKYLSCESISDEELAAAAEKYAVFGRVTPEQKILLIKTLKEAGHTVAMTGDGVNDTLALKESDCSVAMADGSEVARKVSKIVLMNSDFGVLPDVVKEGRRCINNVRMSSVLYLMKTMFTVVLSVLSLITLSGYPFDPKQLLLVEMFVIGLASVMLTVEPNFKRASGSYMAAVLRKSIPNAVVMLIPVFLVQIIGKGDNFSPSAVSAISTMTVTLAAFLNLIFLCIPYTEWRIGVVSAVGSLLVVTLPVSIFMLGDMLHIKPAFENPVFFSIVMGITLLLAFIIHLAPRIASTKGSRARSAKASAR